MYCFIVIFQNSRKKNFSIFTDIQSYFSNQYITTGSVKVYFTIVPAARKLQNKIQTNGCCINALCTEGRLQF